MPNIVNTKNVKVHVRSLPSIMRRHLLWEVDIFVVQIFVVQVDHQGPRPRDLRLFIHIDCLMVRITIIISIQLTIIILLLLILIMISTIEIQQKQKESPRTAYDMYNHSGDHQGPRPRDLRLGSPHQ